MTDIPSPQNGVGYWLGTGYGVTTVTEYTRRKGNPYLGWANTNGRNASLIGALDGAGTGVDEMTPEQAQQLSAVYAALFGPANLGVKETTWQKPHGEGVGRAQYGMFDVLIRNQNLILAQQGQISALAQAVSQISGGGSLDMGALTKAAEKGAREALAGLTLKAQ